MASHRVDPGDDPVDGSLDLVAVHADDALLDAVHGRRAASGDRADEELGELLSAWRAAVDARPLPELVTLDEAVAAVESGRRGAAGGRTGPRLLRRVPLVAAAAVALALVGLGSAVHTALPGQPLWGVSKVVFTDRAASLEGAEVAQEALDGADAAIVGRDLARAQDLLRGADRQIERLRPQEREVLEAELGRVRSSLAPAAPVPGAPGPDATSATTGPSTVATTTTDPDVPTTATSTVPPTPVTPADGTSATTPGAGTPTTTTTPLVPLPLPLLRPGG